MIFAKTMTTPIIRLVSTMDLGKNYDYPLIFRTI